MSPLQNALGGLALDATAAAIRDALLAPARKVFTDGIINANGATIVLACDGMSSFSAMRTGGSATATAFYEASTDGGTTWAGVYGQRTDIDAKSALSLGFSAVGVCAYGALPPGTTHVRLRQTSAGGPCNIRLSASTAPYVAVFQDGPSNGYAVNLSSGSNIWLGFFGAAGGLDKDIAPALLAAGATYTGLTMDTWGSTSPMNSTGWRGAEARISALSDVAGTMYLEASPDNVTWHRIKMAAMTQADASSRFYAEIIHKPTMRYVREVVVNGGAVQTLFRISNMALAA